MEDQFKTPVVTAVILSYNRCKEVLVTVQKLKDLRVGLPFGLEIIVVDNASIDETSQQVGDLHPDIQLVTKEKNNGVAGWNEGFKRVKTKYILVLDDDSCIVDGFTEAVAYLDQHDEIGILALNIVDMEMKGDPNLLPEEGWKHAERIAGFIGCGAIIKTEVFKKIGGFAEWIYLYTHEFEYALRCMDAGFNIVFFEKSNVIHRVSNLNRSIARLRVFATRNEMAIVYKYFGSRRGELIRRVLLNNLKFVKSEGIKSGYYIVKGAFKFLQLKGKLIHTPVNEDIQSFFEQNFWATKPVLINLKRRFLKR